MKITIEQIQKDIAEGKSTHIYYSTRTCWFTHLVSDVEESSKLGIKANLKKHQALMKRKDIPLDEKNKMDSLFKTASKNESMPLDPTGAPLYYVDDPKKWMESALSKPDHYGKHKFNALLLSHHQNCNGGCFDSWDMYNVILDKNPALLK